MKTLLPAARGVAGVLLLSLTRLSADTVPLTPGLATTTGIAGQQSKLTWPAQPGARYRIFRTSGPTTGTTGGWSARAMVEATGPTAEWVDPEPQSSRAFYMVPELQAEVFQIQPPVLSSGGTLWVDAQCLPPNCSLFIEIEGFPSITAPITQTPDGRSIVILPVIAAATSGARVIQVQVRDAFGNAVTTVHQQFEITATGIATLPPPVLPPVVQAVVKTKTKSNQSNDRGNLASGTADTDEDCDDTDDDCDDESDWLIATPTTMIAFAPTGSCASPAARKTSEAKNNLSAIQKRSGAAACVTVYQKTSLSLPTPAGPCMQFRHTYTSRRYGSGAEASSQFDFSWNCRILPVPFAAGVNAQRIILFGGDGRRDVLYREADGTYTCDGAFRSGKFNADTSFTLTFADQSKMIFCPLVGAPWQGRLGSVMDASGVAVNCTYTAAGQLNTVTSQFGQSFTCTWNANNLLSRVTDQTGRYVDLSYYGQGETGGGNGDLKSISCPQIPGQAPLAGPTTFTYTTGFPDDARNHNLLDVRNGENQLLGAFTYSSQTNPAAIDYDTCATSDFSSTPTGLGVHINYHKIEMMPPGSSSPGSYRVITNDPMGRVTECVFTASHNLRTCTCYSGYSVAGMPVTSTTNRPDPLTKLRSTDPDSFETSWLYNGQHLCTRKIMPDGFQWRYTHEYDLNPSCPVRDRGNVRVCTARAPDGQERTITCDYLSGFGTPEGVWDGGDGNGGCTGITKKMHGQAKISEATAVFVDPMSKGWDGRSKKGYDFYQAQSALSQATVAGGGTGASSGGTPDPVFSSNPIPGVGIVVKRNFGPKSSKRVIGGGLGVWAGEDGEGGCTDEDDMWARGTNPDGSDCTNKGRPKLGSAMLARSGIIRLGCGGGTGIAGNLRPGNPIKGISVKGGRNPKPLHITRLTTSLGQVYTCTYDSAGNCLSLRTPITGAGCDATYNALGQCTSLTVLNGPGSSFTQECTYNPATGWLSSHIMDPAGLHLTTTFEANALGLVIRCVDPLGNDYLTEYNALDCVTRTRSPVVGTAPTASRIACDYFYNRAGQCSRMDLENRDPSGALVTTNPAYSRFTMFTNTGMPVRMVCEQRPVDVPTVPPMLDPTPLGIENFHVIDFTYNDAGECVRVSTPAASRGQAEDAVIDYLYDARGKLYRGVCGGLGALTRMTTQLDYDAAGAVTAISLLPSSSAGGAGTPLTTTITYDGFHRPRTCQCPTGSLYVYEYDLQGGVTCSLFGEVHDVPGTANNILLSRSTIQGCDIPVFSASPAAAAAHSYMFRLERSALTVKYYRFAPGEPEPHATQVIDYHYSPAGLLMSVTSNGETLQTNTYDSAARHDTCNADATCMWDTVRDACGSVISFTRTDLASAAGTPSESFTTTCLRDPLGRLISCTDGTGNTVSVSFDSSNRMTQRTSANGVIHRFRWDTSSDDGTGVIQFHTLTLEADLDGTGQYETLRRCTCNAGYYISCTSATGFTRTVTLDPLNRPVVINYPDGTHESWFADSYGRLSTCVHRDGTMCVTEFDRDSRPDIVTYTGGPGTIPADPIDYNCDGRGLVTGVSQGTSIITCTYDSLGNQLSEKHNGYGVTRTFNDHGRNGILYSDGTRFAEVRDKFGRLVSVSSVSSNGVVLSPPVSTVVRLGFRPAVEIRSDGVTTTRDYRSNGEAALPGGTDEFSFDTCVRTVCTNSAGVTFHSTRVRRDHNQQVTQSDVFFTGAAQSAGRRHLQTFDALGYLTSSTIQRREVAGGPFVTESSVTYTIDAEGRRLTATGGPNPGVYTQNATSPPADRQMGQYSTWPGGGTPGGGQLTWDDMGCLTSMGTSTGQKQFVYNTMSQLVAVNNLATGQMIASYAYNARGQRTRSTVAGSTAAQPPVTTYFIYDGDQCIQELGDDGHPNVTMASSEIGGVALCVISRNGSTVYPHGGGNGGGSTDFVYPILPADITLLEEIPIDDDITLCLKASGGGGGHGGGGGGGCAFTTSAGTVSERTDSTDGGELIFLTSDGLVRQGATGTLSGYDWFARGSGCSLIWSPRSNTSLYGRYCPETGFLQCGESVYSPQLGTDVSTQKTKPKPKDKGTLDSPVHGGWDLATNKKV